MNHQDTEKKIVSVYVIKRSQDIESHSNDNEKEKTTEDNLENNKQGKQKYTTDCKEENLLNGILSYLKNLFIKDNDNISIQLVNNNCFGNKNNMDTKFLTKKMATPMTIDTDTLCEFLEKIPEEKLKLIPFEKLPPIIIISNINNNINKGNENSIQVKE